MRPPRALAPLALGTLLLVSGCSSDDATARPTAGSSARTATRAAPTGSPPGGLKGLCASAMALGLAYSAAPDDGETVRRGVEQVRGQRAVATGDVGPAVDAVLAAIERRDPAGTRSASAALSKVCTPVLRAP